MQGGCCEITSDLRTESEQGNCAFSVNNSLMDLVFAWGSYIINTNRGNQNQLIIQYQCMTLSLFNLPLCFCQSINRPEVTCMCLYRCLHVESNTSNTTQISLPPRNWKERKKSIKALHVSVWKGYRAIRPTFVKCAGVVRGSVLYRCSQSPYGGFVLRGAANHTHYRWNSCQPRTHFHGNRPGESYVFCLPSLSFLSPDE